MKSSIKSFQLLAVFVILLSIVCFNTTKTQTIDLNTTFTEDTIWENSQVNQASDILEDIPSTFDLNSSEQEIHKDYLDYFDILQMMKDSNLNDQDLDSSSVHSLIIIMNDGLPLISAYSRGLLVKGRHINHSETVAFPVGVKSYPAYIYLDSLKFDFPEEEHLVIFPNPSGDYVIAYFNSLDFGETGSLTIDNIQGQRLSVIKLKSDQNQMVIDLCNLSNGMYFISLLINNQKIETEKLIKGSN
jgi:hypothetical protein